jgi:tetratricopeptide (TPR) repeat protein
MSLLLEALKKAEKAKEEAQRRAKAADAGGDATPSAFDPESTVLEEGAHVRTRAELPDISAPLEILSDDLRPAAAAGAAPLGLALAEEPRIAQEPKAARREPAAAADSRAGAPAAERATAQRVFEAKFKEPNPRLPFYITMGVLGVFAIGTVIYFWIQLRPAPALVNANPPRSADEKPVDVAALKPAATTGASAAAAPTPASAAAAIPGLPGGAPATSPAAAPAAAQAPASSASVTPPAVGTPPVAAPAAAAKPSATAAPRARRAAETSEEDRSLRVRRPGPQIHPQVASGYAAYQAGDLAKARSEYQQALRDEPANRDALLGLAAVEMRSQRFDLADGYYQRVLQADPRDPHAQAGMVALRNQQLDPVTVESRVKSLIAADRDSNVLYFTLGNQYAMQGRWAEAQQAYFKAFAADPDNPDFAFNLAVSLDQLHQPALALEYYRRALALAEKRSAGFAADIARTRVQQLTR